MFDFSTVIILAIGVLPVLWGASVVILITWGMIKGILYLIRWDLERHIQELYGWIGDLQASLTKKDQIILRLQKEAEQAGQQLIQREARYREELEKARNNVVSGLFKGYTNAEVPANPSGIVRSVQRPPPPRRKQAS